MTIINASASSGLVTSGDTDTTIKFQSNGTTIATISSTGLSTQVGSPAFSVYANGGQTLSSATQTKITFDTEEFDTNNNFASSRFTPTVAGYYQVNATVGVGVSPTQVVTTIYKNGSGYKGGPNIPSCYNTSVSSVVYLNGSTDYIEIYAYFANGQAMGTGISITFFNGSMVRSA